MDTITPTLRFYDQNAERAIQEARKAHEPSTLATFLSLLPPNPVVMDAGCGPGLDLAWFKQKGVFAEGFDGSARMVELASASGAPVQQRDFRLLSLKKEQYDGIWCSRALVHLSIDDCHRVLGSFFQALKPGKGILFVSFLEGTGSGAEPGPDPQAQRTFYFFPENAFLSLLRQSGFQLLMKGERAEDGRKWIALFARRA